MVILYSINKPHPMTKILDGKSLSIELAKTLTKRVERLSTKPKLVIIQIGNIEESNTYIRNKRIYGERIGVKVLHKKYPNNISESKIISDIKKFNVDKSIHGIMMQLPGPKQFNTEKVLESIDPSKDVDGLTALNTKHLFDNKEAFIPATAKGILTLLDEYKIRLKGAKITIVGASALVGRPAMLALLNRGATVTICNKETRNLVEQTKWADILISAVGAPRLIKKYHVSKDQVVVDIGINITKDKKIIGDVDFQNVSKVVKAITPVPGGVGPMTVVSLFQNLLDAYSLQT
jgi:methylenetetrahydrofolate dehydrogenase (NADP+) / methenyltetrahydrofolate cyclohydrolase